MQQSRRTTPYPYTWEIPLTATITVVLTLVLAAHTARTLANAFAGRTVAEPPTLGAVCDTMIEHLDLLCAWAGEHLGVREFRKHAGWYLKGYPVGGEIRRELNQLTSREALAERLAQFDRAAVMLPNGRRAKRGHQNGPRKVALPEHWFERVDDDTALDAAAESATSGG